MEDFRYNYVFFGSDWDLYQHAYSDVLELPNVRYISDQARKRLIKSNPIYHLQFSKWNNYINIPFKSFWNKKYFVDDFESTKPICFIFFEGWEKLNHAIHLTEYLRKTYKDCKIVLFLQDLFDIQKKAFTNEFLNVDEEKQIYDLIISFDQKECQKYGFIYHPLVFSTFKGRLDLLPSSDIYFLGRAKDRLKMLIEVYEILRSRNLKIDFHITGVPFWNNSIKHDELIVF